MGELTRLFGGADVRRMICERLGGVSSHDIGPEPRSEQPPGCTGDPDPQARGHHRACVLGWRWERECALGRCAYRDPTALKADHGPDRCPGVRVIRRLVWVIDDDGTRRQTCATRDDHCERRAKWGKHLETGKTGHRGYVKPGTRLPSDERAPWEREPGEEG